MAVFISGKTDIYYVREGIEQKKEILLTTHSRIDASDVHQERKHGEVKREDR
jgi:hypothetical protein